MKKLSILLAIVLPLLYAASQDTVNRNDLRESSEWQVKKLAFGQAEATFNIERMEEWLRSHKIFVLDHAGSEPRFLVNGEDPVLSPDGDKLAFVERDKDGQGQIEVINLDGSNKTRLTEGKNGGYRPAWSPDGEKIMFMLDGEKSSSIAVISKNGGTVKPIASGRDAQWSPTGEQVVFLRHQKSKKAGTSIWIANSDGTGARKVIEDRPQPRYFSLGAIARFYDQQTLVFSASTGRNWCIFRVKLDGTALEKIAENDSFELSNPIFSPDDKQLVVNGQATTQSESGKKVDDAILLFDLSSKHWVRLANGMSPSVVWEKKTALTETVPARPGIPLQTSTDASLIAKGRERYLAYKCDECHGANGEGGGDGPDLVGTRLNAEEISKFLEKPSPDAYMKGMPNIPVNHPDHQALVAYVLSLKHSSKPN